MNWQRYIKSILRLLNHKKEYKSSVRVYKQYLKTNYKSDIGLSKLQQKEVLDYFAQYGVKLPDTLCHEVFFNTSGKFSPMFIPRYLFRNQLLTKFNQGDTWLNRMKGWRDKNKYDFLNFGRFVPTEGRIVRGMVLCGDYRPSSVSKLCRYFESVADEVVVKISDSYGGQGVSFLPVAELARWIDAKVVESSKMDTSYSIQRPFKQHDGMQRLNASSVNTVRLTTLRLPGLDPFIRSVGPFVRIGRKDSRLDNVAQGNLCVGVHPDGRLNKIGFDKAINSYGSHPDHGYSFEKCSIDQFQECIALCVDMHHHLYEMDMVAWDVVIDEVGTPHVLEFNVEFLDSDYNQACNGPLFGDDTNYVLKTLSPVK